MAASLGGGQGSGAGGGRGNGGGGGGGVGAEPAVKHFVADAATPAWILMDLC